ncbi:hypothetical protein E2C01_014483 [Portunus trituberculatus]|uniref:Uncharacterized protein n=1 Tax=Portunus trituberculatus TaxID=210409 RepID=A0A5B7DK44_PORTR|nr:hypothetical protein [Portunus trituberculatus]
MPSLVTALATMQQKTQQTGPPLATKNGERRPVASSWRRQRGGGFSLRPALHRPLLAQRLPPPASLPALPVRRHSVFPHASPHPHSCTTTTPHHQHIPLPPHCTNTSRRQIIVRRGGGGRCYNGIVDG